MTTEDHGSISRWLDDLKAGQDLATRQLWDRYFESLVRLARARLRDAPRGDADEEDLALSAFHSLCRGAASGRFSRLTDRHDLWRLLVAITAQKAVDHRRRQGRRKRRTVARDPSAAEDNERLLTQVVGVDPSPEFAALMAEQYRSLLGRLPDELLRRIAVWKMEGYTNAEIAERLGRGVRTIERKLAVIRAAWLAFEPD